MRTASQSWGPPLDVDWVRPEIRDSVRSVTDPWPASLATRRDARVVARAMAEKYRSRWAEAAWRFRPIRLTVTVQAG